MTHEDGIKLLTILMYASISIAVVLLIIVFIVLFKMHARKKAIRGSSSQIGKMTRKASNVDRKAKLMRKIMIAEAKGKLGKRYQQHTQEYEGLLDIEEIIEKKKSQRDPRHEVVNIEAFNSHRDETIMVQLKTIENGDDSFEGIIEKLKNVPRLGVIVPDNVAGDPPGTLTKKNFAALPRFLLDGGIKLVGVSYVRPTSSSLAKNVGLRFRYGSKLIQKRIDIQFNQTPETIALSKISLDNIVLKKEAHKKSLKYFMKRGIEAIEIIGVDTSDVLISNFEVTSMDDVSKEAKFKITVTGVNNRDDAISKEFIYTHRFGKSVRKPTKSDDITSIVADSIAPTLDPIETKINFAKYFGSDFSLNRIWFNNKKWALDRNSKEVEYKIVYNKVGRTNIEETIVVQFVHSYNEYEIRTIKAYDIMIKNYPIFIGQSHEKVHYNKYKNIFTLRNNPEAKIKFETKKLKNIRTTFVDLLLEITLGNFQTTVPITVYEQFGKTCLKIKGAQHG